MINGGLIGALRIQRGTLTSRYLQLYNAFFVSAVIHHIGALNCPYSALARYQFYLFMIQPVAITMEDAAIYLGKRAGLKDTCKFVGRMRQIRSDHADARKGKPEL